MAPQNFPDFRVDLPPNGILGTTPLDPSDGDARRGLDGIELDRELDASGTDLAEAEHQPLPRRQPHPLEETAAFGGSEIEPPIAAKHEVFASTVGGIAERTLNLDVLRLEHTFHFP